MGDDEPIAMAGAPAERRSRSRTAWRTRSRWLVHLGLLVCAAAALGTLQLLHIRNAIHADVGLAFAGLVIVHLAQRRHRREQWRPACHGWRNHDTRGAREESDNPDPSGRFRHLIIEWTTQL